MQIKYYTLAAVCEPTDLNPFYVEYLGTLETEEEATETARGLAVRLNMPVDAMACCVNPADNRTVRFHPDGKVEKLWEEGDNE